MKRINWLLILAGLIIGYSCHSQKVKNKISINIPTVEQEASSIWRTINDIDFFEKQGYTIALPDAPLIDSLILKSKNKAFGNDDFPAIYQLLETGVYSKTDYQIAVGKVAAEQQLINGVIYEIEQSKTSWDWDFKLFDTYDIVFTLYGTGGSYDPNTGTVTLFTTNEGKFKKYKNPANTIIHEITHLGMEESIVQKYKLSHGLKERIIDRFVYLMFKEQLPNYKVQNMGNVKIDDYLKSKDDLKKLDAVLRELIR